MSKTVVLVGRMCSGKTTLAKALEEKGFKRIITYTTRPMRDGEVDGVDYHFIGSDEFKRLYNTGFFAETTIYKDSSGYLRYGSCKYDYSIKNDTVIILNPQGVISLREAAFVVYLDIPSNLLLDRARDRGYSQNEIRRRFDDDRFFFEDMLNIRQPDMTITKLLPVEELVKRIIYSVK